MSLPRLNPTTSTDTNHIKIPDWQLEAESKEDAIIGNDNDKLDASTLSKEEASSTHLNLSDITHDFKDAIDTSIRSLESFNDTSMTDELHEVGSKDIQEESKKEDDKETKPSFKQGNAKIIEATDKGGKKKYRVDPDLLIGYSRRTII